MRNSKHFLFYKFLSGSFLCLVLLLIAQQVGAQTIASGLQTAAGTAGLPGGADADLGVMIGRIIGGLMGIVGSLLFLYMLYGGFRWMTAGGDSASVTKAVSIIKNAIIGIMIIIFAYSLSNFVVTRLASVAGEPSAPPSGSGGETCPYSCATQSDIQAAQDINLIISCQNSSACPAGTQCCDFSSP